MKNRLSSGLLALTIGMVPGVALAHTGVGETIGFAHGLAHPIAGLDHMLAMVMVGILACQIGGRALWLVPGTFVMAMAGGGGLGVFGVALPFVETAIALSVVALGAAVAFGLRAPVVVAMGLVGLFAIFHGHAHGSEMPDNASGIAYGLGFMAATALLHIAGIGMGLLVGGIGERYGSVAVRTAGGLAAAAGVGILTGIL